MYMRPSSWSHRWRVLAAGAIVAGMAGLVPMLAAAPAQAATSRGQRQPDLPDDGWLWRGFYRFLHILDGGAEKLQQFRLQHADAAALQHFERDRAAVLEVANDLERLQLDELTVDR